MKAWEKQFLAFMREQMPEVRKLIADKKEINPDIETQLRGAIDAFNKQFKA